MSIKTSCLFVIIGVVVAFNCQVDATMPENVIVQLHHVVRLLNFWAKQNNNIYNKKFIQKFRSLGFHVRCMVTLVPPTEVSFCLWQLNILTNHMEKYQRITSNDDEVSSEDTMIKVFNFLQMIENQLTHEVVGLDIQNPTTNLINYDSDELLIGTVIPKQIDILSDYIYEAIKSSDRDADEHSLGSCSPNHLYLHQLVRSKSQRSIMEDSHRVQWHSEYLDEVMLSKYKAAVYESADCNRYYTHLIDFRYFVFVQTILVSVLGILDVHFNAYILHVKHVGDTGSDEVWNSVVNLMEDFNTLFLRVYGNSVVNVIHTNLMLAGDLNNRKILLTACNVANNFLKNELDNHLSVMSSIVVDRGNTADMLMKEASYATQERFHEQFMRIAEENYKHLKDYMTILNRRFEDVDRTQFVHFLNLLH